MTDKDLEAVFKDLLDPDMLQARAEATEEIVAGVVKVITDVTKAHGKDPFMQPIISAAIARVIIELDKINPEIETTIIKLLEYAPRD
jgi:hypothetical protein